LKIPTLDHFATVFILELQTGQIQNFQTTITQSFLKSKFMTKSVDIENCNGSSKMQKYLKTKFGKIFKKIFGNRQFLIIEKRYFIK